MRLLVLSDIHADAEGLEEVLAAAASEGWQQVLLLGDLVGYGSGPARTLELLAGLDVLASVGGNHEQMLGDLRAGAALRLQDAVLRPLQLCIQQLDASQLDYLTGLPDRASFAGWQALHGGPESRFDYLLSAVDLRRAEPHLATGLTLVGHTHVPGMFLRGEAGRWQVRPARREVSHWQFEPGAQAVLNPGSVFRNRDSAGGRSYGILDLDEYSFTVHRM